MVMFLSLFFKAETVFHALGPQACLRVGRMWPDKRIWPAKSQELAVILPLPQSGKTIVDGMIDSRKGQMTQRRHQQENRKQDVK